MCIYILYPVSYIICRPKSHTTMYLLQNMVSFRAPFQVYGFHHKDNTVIKPAYLYGGNTHTVLVRRHLY